MKLLTKSNSSFESSAFFGLECSPAVLEVVVAACLVDLRLSLNYCDRLRCLWIGDTHAEAYRVVVIIDEQSS